MIILKYWYFGILNWYSLVMNMTCYYDKKIILSYFYVSIFFIYVVSTFKLITTTDCFLLPMIIMFTRTNDQCVWLGLYDSLIGLFCKFRMFVVFWFLIKLLCVRIFLLRISNICRNFIFILLCLACFHSNYSCLEFHLICL